ncbi:MAG: hypothetical protein DHS20C16_28600 [Phycisphaerae bacterium]|nr:MAG: hypothetical protein DHS20C16_28600 [Phycisphaerae bacterium]
MSYTITIRDETTGGDITVAGTLEFETERTTVRELIRSRVYQDVKDHNALQNQQLFGGLIQPTDTESDLNGYRFKKPRQVDWKKQFEVALKGFEEYQILILVNDRQVESLDDEVILTRETVVSFLRLIPLIGG